MVVDLSSVDLVSELCKLCCIDYQFSVRMSYVAGRCNFESFQIILKFSINLKHEKTSVFCHALLLLDCCYRKLS